MATVLNFSKKLLHDYTLGPVRGLRVQFGHDPSGNGDRDLRKALLCHRFTVILN